jgi:predicted RNase H-like HicB family nuclease
MAGTLPHAVFVETDLDPSGTAAAFAGELPGCAAFGSGPAEAVAAVPARVGAFVAWLRAHGEALTEPVGNWYEVERAPAAPAGESIRRATFSLDELPPSAGELATWLHWADLAREDLADALDATPGAVLDATWIADQDLALAADLGASHAPPDGAPPLDRLYAARDVLIEALGSAGLDGGVRRVIRLVIADDLRMTERLRDR